MVSELICPDVGLLYTVSVGQCPVDMYIEIIQWCIDRLEPYGVGWLWDAEKFELYLTDDSAVLFSLRWC